MPKRDFTGMSKYNIPDWLAKKKTGQGISGNIGAKTFPKNPFADVSGFNPYILTEVDENGKLRRGIWKKPEELIAHGYVYSPETKGWALPKADIGYTNALAAAQKLGQTPEQLSATGYHYDATTDSWILSTTTTEVHHERGMAPTTPLSTNIFNVAPDIFGQGLQVGATVVLDGINPDGTYRWKLVSQPTGGGKAVNTF